MDFGWQHHRGFAFSYDGCGMPALPGRLLLSAGRNWPSDILRPDGTVFVAGGTPKGGTSGHTAVYHPSTKAWVAGPNFPTGDDAGDSSAVLLPSGNVLVYGNSGMLYEFNGATLKPTRRGVGAPVLMLPTGQALVEGFNLAVYNATGTVQAGWKPVIKTAPSVVTHGMTYTISGTQLNGLSQAAAFGDEFETSTNYPLVRITNNSSKHVFYARTHDHTSMGVATGNLIVTSNFDVPTGIETGLYAGGGGQWHCIRASERNGELAQFPPRYTPRPSNHTGAFFCRGLANYQISAPNWQRHARRRSARSVPWSTARRSGRGWPRSWHDGFCAWTTSRRPPRGVERHR